MEQYAEIIGIILLCIIFFMFYYVIILVLLVLTMILPGDAATAEDYNNMAVYFENQRQSLLAGKFYNKANLFQKALIHLLRCPVTEGGESVMLSIETVCLTFFNSCLFLFIKKLYFICFGFLLRRVVNW